MAVTLKVALDEANRCLGCKNPQCMQGCPIHTPIPEVIKMFKEGKVEEAGKILADHNPMTTICCLVCDHEKQCEGNCILGKKATPVHFSMIEDYISTQYAQLVNYRKPEWNGKRICVIGAGPAGMTVAINLAKLGYKVDILDSNAKVGGVMRYCIPKFRLPDEVMDTILEKTMKPLGITVRPNTTVGEEVSIEDLFRDGYDAIFAGAGLWRPRKLGIKGESYAHVCYGFQYLQSPESYIEGKNVAVIGVGNSAIDCARTAIRRGAKKVTCYARRDGITASRTESLSATHEGIEFVFCHRPVEIYDDKIEFAITEKQEDGRFVDAACEHEFCEADQVIICAGQLSRFNLASKGESNDMRDHVGLAVDENCMTDFPGIFAGGDMTVGNLTVVHAVEDAKIAADAIHRYVMNK